MSLHLPFPAYRQHRRGRSPLRPLAGLVLITATLLADAAAAQFPVIELAAVAPPLGQVGTTFELHLAAGENLDAVEQLVFSDPRIVADRDTQEAQPGRFRVTIPADVEPGRYELWAVGAAGVSNPRVFAVSRYPVVTLAAVSQDESQPTPLETPPEPEPALVIPHRASPARIDYYRLSGSVKSPRRVRLDAQRLDSRMIGQIRLIGPDGRTLQTARGADGADPKEVIIPAGATGEFTLAVHDFLYRGGDRYFYALTIASAESDAEPLTAAIANGRLPNGDGLEAVSVVEPKQDVQAVVADAMPSELVPPCVIESSFPADRREQVYHFAAEAGRQLSIEVVSQRLGQRTDPRLTVERQEVSAEGQVVWQPVASEDDPPAIGDAAMRLRSKDPSLLFTAPATATYRVRLRNLDTGQALATEPRYRLTLAEPEPEVRLVAMFPYPHSDAAQTRPRGCQLLRGDTQPVRVQAVRRDGLTGAIELSIPDLPPGLTCPPVTIAANQSEAVLTVVASEDAAPWTGDVEVVGRWAAGEQTLSRTAAAATVIWGTGEQRDVIRTRVATKLMLSVSDQAVTPVSIRLGGEPAATKLGTSLSLPITLTRREGGGAAVIVRPRNLPPGVTAGEVTIAADQSAGSIELKVAADAKPGSYAVWLQAETKVTFKPITQAEPRELTVFLSSNTATIELTDSP